MLTSGATPLSLVIQMKKERMRPVGDFTWLDSVLKVSFSALTLFVGWQGGLPAHSKPVSLCRKSSVLEHIQEER